MKTILTLTAALMVASAASHARMVTIVATNDGGHYSVTNEIQSPQTKLLNWSVFRITPALTKTLMADTQHWKLPKAQLPTKSAPRRQA